MATITKATARGLRPYQEDRFVVAQFEAGTLIAVFDGHGGESVAQYCASHVVSIFTSLITNHGFWKERLTETCRILDGATHGDYEGCSASIVFIPENEDVAFIAILGDSPVIAEMPSGLTHVSPEHNVRTNQTERAAAEERGGFYSNGYICRSFSGGGLQMARAFGDAELGRVVSKVPEVYDIPIGKWLLVCTDGATDPGHGAAEAAIKDIVAKIAKGATARGIVNRALKVPTGDNVTAVLWRRDDPKRNQRVNSGKAPSKKRGPRKPSSSN